jgi:hypothetical protein
MRYVVRVSILLAILMSLIFLDRETRAAKCYRSMITAPAPYNANGGEVIRLNNGTFWQDIGYNYLYLYAYYPTVIICPSIGIMMVEGHKIQVKKLK